MLSRCGIFCTVVKCGSFTKAAERIGYTQSAVSQTVRALEREIGVTLIDRTREGVTLTPDGTVYFPYLSAVAAAERSLDGKKREMDGLENATVRIGTFTSVSRTVLPGLMREFRERYPQVRFELRQSEYTEIGEWIRSGRVDFGFVNPEGQQGLQTRFLCRDRMVAVLPRSHPLAGRDAVSLAQLAKEPLILLDEGERSVLLGAFRARRLTPRISDRVFDDDTILSMVRAGMGVSALYRRILTGDDPEIAVRPILEGPEREVSLAWRSRDTMPLAARRFTDLILSRREVFSEP